MILIHNLLLASGLFLFKRKEYKEIRLWAKVSVISLTCDVVVSCVCVVDMNIREMLNKHEWKSKSLSTKNMIISPHNYIVVSLHLTH